jgi:hypothetical protein
MKLLNFSHPLTAVQLAVIEQQTAQAVDRVMDVKSHFDPAQSFVEQVQALVDGIGLSSQEWQTTPLLINPPSLSVIACVVLAELHGRMGYFPPVLRLRPVQGSVPSQFEVAEIVNLQLVREQARAKR